LSGPVLVWTQGGCVAIDDPLEKSALAAEIRDDTERAVQQMLAKSGMAGAISLIPFGVGSAINEMLTQLALRRVNERMGEMFDRMTKQILELGEEKTDREWFRSEEFQTLLFEALHQLHVTRDKQKIEMLGKALANSGAKDFAEESQKELFVQLVRDLTSQHVALLCQLLPRPARPESDSSQERGDWWLWRQRPEVLGQGTDLLTLQMLAANGLVEETLKTLAAREPSLSTYPSQSEVDKAIKDFIKQLQRPPLRYFRLSDLGIKFLKFVGLDPSRHQTERPTSNVT